MLTQKKINDGLIDWIFLFENEDNLFVATKIKRDIKPYEQISKDLFISYLSGESKPITRVMIGFNKNEQMMF